MKVKRKSPSRIRYEKRNPTVSCRVSRDIYDRLKNVDKTQNLSMADILKIGLGKIEPKVETREKLWGQGYEEGFEVGWQVAESIFRVTYRCCVCGQILGIDTVQELAAAGNYMTENGWGHASCHNQC